MFLPSFQRPGFIPLQNHGQNYSIAYSDSYVFRHPGYTTEMYCVSCEVPTEFIYVMQKKVDRRCGIVVRVPGYTTEMYYVSSEVPIEFIYSYVM
jgi:hypothetical protein